MKPQDAAANSDEIMLLLLEMFKSGNMRAGGVQEDALLAVSSLVEGSHLQNLISSPRLKVSGSSPGSVKFSLPIFQIV